jgi:hypothetical protein
MTKDGHIPTAPVMVNCPDDKAAIEHANVLQNGLDLEVWEGPRQVAVLKSDQHV